MHIAPGEKFACFAFRGYGLGEDLPEQLQLGPRLWAVRKLDLAVAEPWHPWMGWIKMDALAETNFAIYTTAPSSTPTVLDQENVKLGQALYYLLHGILLQGVPGQSGLFLNGANLGGEINVRQFGELPDYRPSFGIEPFRLGLKELQRAARVMPRLRAVNEGGVDWARLRRGLKALFNGTALSNEDGSRLHQFVRAVEGLVKPPIGNSRSDFAQRISQTFTPAHDEIRDTLLELFDLRSYVEHMHWVLDALEGDDATRIAKVNRRTRQIDVLARDALLRVMESDALTGAFRSDPTIDAFWQMDDAQRTALWGQRFDIRTVV